MDVSQLEDIATGIRARLDETHAAREHALAESRKTIQMAASIIRSIHLGQLQQAHKRLSELGERVRALRQDVEEHHQVSSAGFAQDAQKEYAEAACTWALVAGQPFPDPDVLGVEAAPYLNGLAEACGELRRHILDLIRLGEVQRAEQHLSTMDEVYHVLSAFDYPDAVSGGLRHRVDAVRGFLERTRGDLTRAVRQAQLEAAMTRLEQKL
jgi:translin